MKDTDIALPILTLLLAFIVGALIIVGFVGHISLTAFEGLEAALSGALGMIIMPPLRAPMARAPRRELNGCVMLFVTVIGGLLVALGIWLFWSMMVFVAYGIAGAM
jgi:hypothetical protein